MVAHDNTVMNATITNATPSADDESTSGEHADRDRPTA